VAKTAIVEKFASQSGARQPSKLGKTSRNSTSIIPMSVERGYHFAKQQSTRAHRTGRTIVDSDGTKDHCRSVTRKPHCHHSRQLPNSGTTQFQGQLPWTHHPKLQSLPTQHTNRFRVWLLSVGIQVNQQGASFHGSGKHHTLQLMQKQGCSSLQCNEAKPVRIQRKRHTTCRVSCLMLVDLKDEEQSNLPPSIP
jgi:hypothetical protein